MKKPWTPPHMASRRSGGRAPILRIQIADFDRTFGKGGTAPEPLDPDVSYGCLGELRWDWPKNRITEDGRLEPATVEELTEVNTRTSGELTPIVERYLSGFRDRVPSQAAMKKAHKEWTERGLGSEAVAAVCNHIVAYHQIEGLL